MLTLGNAWHAAWRHPDQRAEALLPGDGGRVEDWIEETLRWDPPSQALARTTTEDVELHGATIPADARVLLLVGAAAAPQPQREPRPAGGPHRPRRDRGRRRRLRDRHRRGPAGPLLQRPRLRVPAQPRHGAPLTGAPGVRRSGARS
ncbi:hypothetical protein GCM10023088_74150 [Actinomadura verrucosospora]|uniref:cytochrome P450 n=1 Tax=Actinomadura verrucosospora TaxID=46165 RepID=UPI0031EDED54